MSDRLQIINNDALSVLKSLPSDSIQLCITSPPYFHMREYLKKHDPNKQREIGCKSQTLPEYLDALFNIFMEVRRVLTHTGSFWLNIGDKVIDKETLSIPWRLAIRLQDAGFHLIQSIIWNKPNGQSGDFPRCPRTHEDLFHFAKSKDYLFNREAILEPYTTPINRWSGHVIEPTNSVRNKVTGHNTNRYRDIRPNPKGKQRRSVWTIPVARYGTDKKQHYATFPPRLALYPILACTRPHDTVLDPFAGAGVAIKEALRLNRKAIAVELSAYYCGLIEQSTIINLPLDFESQDQATNNQQLPDTNEEMSTNGKQNGNKRPRKSKDSDKTMQDGF